MTNEELIEAYKREYHRTSGSKLRRLTYDNGWFTFCGGTPYSSEQKIRRNELENMYANLKSRPNYAQQFFDM